MSQTTHTIEMLRARPGLIDDTAAIKDVLSYLAEDSAGAGAGTFMVPGTDGERQCVAPSAAADITAGDGFGVVVYDASHEYPSAAATITAGNEYDDEDMVPVLRKGRIWVLCDAAATITANSVVFVRHASGGGGSKLGTFREDADTATAAQLPGAFFRSAHLDVDFGAGTQRVALVELNLPQTA